MVGSNIPPYRAPCSSSNGVIPISWMGPLYSQGHIAPYTKSIMVDNSLMLTSGSPSMVTPYQRCQFNSEAGCEVTCCGDGADTTWCVPFIGQNYNQYSMVDGQANSRPTRIWSGSSYITSNPCRQQGFRNAMGMLVWQGCFGFLSEAVGADLTNCFTCDSCSMNLSQLANYTPDQTKYLIASYDFSYEAQNEATGHFQTDTAGASGARSVDQYSGEITNTVLSTETEYGKPYYDETSWNYWITKYVSGGIGYTVEEFGDPEVPIQTGGDTIIDGDLNGAPYGWSDLAGVGDMLAAWNEALSSVGYPQIQFNDIASQNGWSIMSTYVDPSSYWGNPQTLNITVTRTNTGYSLSIHKDIQSDNDPSTSDFMRSILDYSLSITLSGANPFSNLVSDMTNLLSYWPLNKESIWDYQWRTDGCQSIAPLMSRNQIAQSPLGFGIYYVNDLRAPIASASIYNGGGYGQMQWFDTACNYFWWNDTNQYRAADALVKGTDGSILGAPSSSGSNGQNVQQFDYNAINWGGCIFDDGEGLIEFEWYQDRYGFTAADVNGIWGSQLPSTATQWMNNFQAIGNPPQASMMYADQTNINQNDYCNGAACRAATGGAFIGIKYAEIKERFPSQNFARPGGDDKFLIDEPNVVCVSSSVAISGSGQSFQISTNTGTATTLSSSNGIWGGSSVNGFYSVTEAGHIVTLSTKQYNLPSNWISNENNGSDGIDTNAFGSLRFPGAPSLLGRQTFGILYTAPSGSHSASFTGSFTTPQPAFGMSATTTPSGSEQVDIYDWKMSVLNSNIQVTRIDDSNFMLPYTPVGYSGSVYIMNHGAPAYQWNDQFSKGDYLRTELLWDNRTNGEAARLAFSVVGDDCHGNPYVTHSTNLGYASFVQAQQCIAQVPCCPSVLCYSPNGETWPIGTTFAMPTSFTADTTYGSRWQGGFTQLVTDPYWQTPHKPCGWAGSWGMDAGICNSDDDFHGWYALSPMVEPRLTVPVGAPTMSNGIQLGYSDPTVSTASNAFVPILYLGFNADGTPASYFSPWDLENQVCDTIAAGDCRFPYQDLWFPCDS